jgi:hypothetical protein
MTDPNIIAAEILAELSTTTPPLNQTEANATGLQIWENINTALIKYYTGNVVVIYQRSILPPSTPTGDTPAVWSTTVPAGANTLWFSIGTKNAITNLIDTWSIPTPTTLSFVNGTRTLSIAPTGTNYTFYVQGNSYTKTSDSIVITNVEGNHLIYYDATGTLVENVNGSIGTIYPIIRDYAIVSYIYWNATSSASVMGPLKEQHGYLMDGETHAYLHFNLRCRWNSGLALSSILVDQSGSLASHAQWGTDTGVIQDEDLRHTLSAVSSTAGYPIYYNSGATSYLRRGTLSTFGVLTTGTGRLAYNNVNSGGTGIWGLSEVSNNNFVVYHVFATNDQSNPVISVMGQTIYTTISSARNGATSELNSIVTAFPSPEFKALGSIIFQTSDSYSNAVKARIRSTDTGGSYIDWRKDQTGSSVAPSDHNSLMNLQLATTGVTYGHITDTTQSLYGSKTFINDTYFTTALLSTVANTATLGNATYPFGDLFLGNGGTINFDNGDAEITHSANTLTVYGANFTVSGIVSAAGAGGFASSTYITNSRNPIWRFGNSDGFGLSYFQGTAGYDGSSDSIGVHFGTATGIGSDFVFDRGSGGRFIAPIIMVLTGIVPDVNDGAYLGTSALQFSDLFLAEGGVINWDNGDVVLTQTGDNLGLVGGSFGVGRNNPATLFEVYGNHTTTRALLYAETGQAAPNANAFLHLWASEPGLTYSGTGISNNWWYNSGWTRITSTRGGSYIRLLESQILFNVIDGAGTNTSAGGIDSTGRYAVNIGIVPDANDGAYLGTPTLGFSDLFLAEGAVINWDNGDVTLTQTGDNLYLDGVAYFITRLNAANPFHHLNCYSDTLAHRGVIDFNKSASDTLDVNVATVSQDYLGSIRFWGNSGSAQTIGATIHAVQTAAAGTNTPTTLYFSIANGTTDAYAMMIGNNRYVYIYEGIIPDANDGATLGLATYGFSDLFLAEGAVINWDNGDCTITQADDFLYFNGVRNIYHSYAAMDTALCLRNYSDTTTNYSYISFQKSATDTLGGQAATGNGDILGGLLFYGNNGTSITYGAEMRVVQMGAASTQTPSYFMFYTSDGTTAVPTMQLSNGGRIISYVGIVPDANDGAYLGTSALGFSDLFLASGAVINFANSDFTITHASNSLALEGGSITLSEAYGIGAGSSTWCHLPVLGGGRRGSTTSTETGYIKINLPVFYTYAMLHFIIDIYEYASSKSISLHVSGYNYAGTNTWTNCSANIITSSISGTDYTVTFGNDGTYVGVYISKGSSGASTTWGYPQIVVRDFFAGYSGALLSSFISGWAISITASPGTGQVSILAYSPATLSKAETLTNKTISGYLALPSTSSTQANAIWVA